MDETDLGTDPRLLIYLEHAIRDGRAAKSGEPRAVSQRLQFIHLKEDGSHRMPVLRPISTADQHGRGESRRRGYGVSAVAGRSRRAARARLRDRQRSCPQHLAEVKQRRLAEIDKVEREVRDRLNREINYWDTRAARLREEERAGKEQRINAQNAEATAQRLVERLHKRQEELDRERQITALPPVLKGAALVIPQGLLTARRTPSIQPDQWRSQRRPGRARQVEKAAMDAVMAAERELGNLPRDVSAEKKGYDIESRDPRSGHLRFIEVKGRHADGRDVIITKNELLASLNAPEAFILALVRIGKRLRS